MAVTIKHAKTDTIADWTQSDLDAQIAAGNYPVGTVLADIVLPSDWNNDHTISGTLPIANGGTGQTTANAAFNALAPSQTGNNGKYLTTDGTNTSWASNPLGDVTGPSLATDNAIARFDTTTGKLIQNSVVTVSDTGDIAGATTITDINYVDFNTGYTTTLAAGQLGWDGNNTLGLGMSGGNVVQEIGLQSYIYGKASSAITKGQLIKKSGVNGTSGVITFAPTTANMTNADDIIGIAAETIALNGFGYIISTGNIRGFNTTGSSSGETWADGDALYYNPTGSGLMTNVKPSAPNLKVQIGIITNASSGGSGSFVVEINHGSVLGGTDSNVQLTSPTNGQILTYDTYNTYWKNTSLTAGTGISISAATGGTLTVTNSAPDQTVSIAGTSPVSVTGTYPSFTVSMTQANTSTNGWLSSTDWNTFNNKQPAGTYVTSVGATSPVTSTGGTTPTIAMPAATTSVSGYLTSTDWNTFNNKGSGSVTNVSGVAPVTVATGTTTPVISMAAATGSVNGYLTSTDWTTFNGKQTAYTNLSTFGTLANSAGWLYNNGTGTLSYSTPTASDVGAVPTSRTLTINGTAYDLTANRTWSVGTVTSVAALTLGTSGTDLSSTVATGTTTPVITLNVPTASATNRGALSAADWTTFNNKGSGTVTSTSVVSANGFAGTVATATTTPAITISTSITGMLKGNGTAISAGTAGTDYVAPATATNFTAQQYFGNATLTDGATIAWAANTQQVATFTFVTSNRTMGAPTGLVNGAYYGLAVIQNSGSNTLTWNSVFKWTGGSAPTLSTAAGAKDYFVFRSDGTNLYEQGRSLGVA